MNTCYLVGAGENDFLPTPDSSDLVIAADGGYDFLISHGVHPNLLIGDLDSISNIPSNLEIIKHPVEKDETDMHLAYLIGKERGYNKFIILGGMGGRPDHTFANYSLLLHMANSGMEAKMISKRQSVEVIKNGEKELSGTFGATFSIFAFGGYALGVSIKGAKYEADRVDLSPDFPLGVSNSFLSSKVSVSVERGALLIMTEL